MRGFVSGLEPWVLAYLLNSLWQVPLVFCAAFAAARIAHPAGPRMEHRIWVGALLLQVALPLCNFQLSELGQRAWGLVLWFRHAEATDGQTRVIFNAGEAVPVQLPWLTSQLLAAVAIAYACALLYFVVRLLWGVWITESMRRRAASLDLPIDTTQRVDHFQSMLGMPWSDVNFAHTTAISGPATVGVRHPTLLLPGGFLDGLGPNELDAVLAHELAHMERNDFAKNLLYGFLSLPVAYHPLLRLTRSKLAETRELVCDAMAAEALGGRENYARSLLRLASMLSDRTDSRVLYAIGILDANIFERRVMHLTRRSLEIRGVRRLAIGAACALVAIATCTSALALHMNVDSPPAKGTAVTKVHVKVSELTIEHKVQPEYPVDAKKAKIQGKVQLSAILGKDGTVEQLKVISGPSALQQSSLDAVRQWTYKPYLLNGDPIEVETTIIVIYTLGK